jgi:hypothetical protein
MTTLLEAGVSHILRVKGPVYVDSLEQGIHDGHHLLVHYPTSRTTTTGLIPKPEQYVSTQLLIDKRKAGNLHPHVKPSIAYSYI